MAINKLVRRNRGGCQWGAEPNPGHVRPSILDLWATGIRRDPVIARAMGSVLLERPELVDELHDLSTAVDHLRRKLMEDLAYRGRGRSSAGLWLAATALLLESAGQRSEALALCRDVMPALLERCATDSSVISLMEPFLRKEGAEDSESRELFLQLRSACLMTDKPSGGELELRTMAFDAFSAGRVVEAERIYRQLIARRFEPAGTRAHLARLLIATGREQEATAILRKAWAYVDQDPFYVVGRILFLQALLFAMTGEDAMAPLSFLKGIIERVSMQMHWTMEAVLALVAPRLSDEQRELFAALLAAINSSREMRQLEALPAWQRINPVQLGGN